MRTVVHTPPFRLVKHKSELLHHRDDWANVCIPIEPSSHNLGTQTHLFVELLVQEEEKEGLDLGMVQGRARWAQQQAPVVLIERMLQREVKAKLKVQAKGKHVQTAVLKFVGVSDAGRCVLMQVTGDGCECRAPPWNSACGCRRKCHAGSVSVMVSYLCSCCVLSHWLCCNDWFGRYRCAARCL